MARIANLRVFGASLNLFSVKPGLPAAGPVTASVRYPQVVSWAWNGPQAPAGQETPAGQEALRPEDKSATREELEALLLFADSNLPDDDPALDIDEDPVKAYDRDSVTLKNHRHNQLMELVQYMEKNKTRPLPENVASKITLPWLSVRRCKNQAIFERRLDTTLALINGHGFNPGILTGKICTLLPETVGHRIKVLNEMGIIRLTKSILSRKWKAIPFLTESQLKMRRLVSPNVDVLKVLLDSCLNLRDEDKDFIRSRIETKRERLTMSWIKVLILQVYLERKLGEDCPKLDFLLMREDFSLADAMGVIDILVDHKITSGGISSYKWHHLLSNQNPSNLKQFIEELPFIAGMPVTRHLAKFPVLFDVKLDTVKARLSLLREDLGFSDAQIAKCPIILAYRAETIKNRFNYWCRLIGKEKLQGYYNAVKLMHNEPQYKYNLRRVRQTGTELLNLDILLRSPDAMLENKVKKRCLRDEHLSLFCAEFALSKSAVVKKLKENDRFGSFDSTNARQVANYLMNDEDFSIEQISTGIYVTLYNYADVQNICRQMKNTFEESKNDPLVVDLLVYWMEKYFKKSTDEVPISCFVSDYIDDPIQCTA